MGFGAHLNKLISLTKKTIEMNNILAESRVEMKNCEFQGYVQIGYRSYANHSFFRNVSIGRYCSIGRRCSIGAAKHDIAALTTHPAAATKGFVSDPHTVIGNDVWVGDNVVIVSGINIGDGAIVGGGAVVTKDVPAYSIAVGVPAKILRMRFDQPLIDDLIASRWWTMGDDALPGSETADIKLHLAKLREYPIEEFKTHYAPLKIKI